MESDIIMVFSDRSSRTDIKSKYQTIGWITEILGKSKDLTLIIPLDSSVKLGKLQKMERRNLFGKAVR